MRDTSRYATTCPMGPSITNYFYNNPKLNRLKFKVTLLVHMLSMKKTQQKQKQDTVHQFTRTFRGTYMVTTATANPLNTSQAFRLNLLPNYAEFTTLFDQYRIDRIDAKFMSPYTNTEQVPGSTTTPDATLYLHTCNDYDDATAISPATMQEYETYKVSQLSSGKPVVMSFVPHIALSTYAAGFGSFANFKPQWIDAASAGVEHYGLKYDFEVVCGDGSPGFMNGKYTFDVFFTYHVSCRSVR